MKSTLHPTAGTGAQGAQTATVRLFPEFSFQKAARQVPNLPAKSSQARSATAPQTRAYRKALRQAEMAAWETNSAARTAAALNANPSRIPLPWQTQTRSEGAMYLLLAVLALGTLGHELWTSFELAGNWNNFVQLVRQLLA